MYCLSKLHYEKGELREEQTLQFADDAKLLKLYAYSWLIYLQREGFYHDEKLTLYDLDIDELDNCLWYDIIYKENRGKVDEVVIFAITRVPE